MASTDRIEPRKRPGQARSTETVAVILEAAARILEERGLGGYTTNAVAARAGVSIGSLYQYFPGKDALTAALIERETAVLLSDIAAAREEPDGRAALTRMIAAGVAHQMRRPALARLLDFEERRLPMQASNGRVADRICAALAQVLGSRPDAVTAVPDVLAIIRGMVDDAGERGETDPRPLERRVARAVFGYLGWPG
ncbi:TetR/AcrR family transcriptional regulator [Mycobacterium sp. KBS0706]|uniref:TetR/AcrR family transcriptional regulator n=1 Tax=Mycobacterium sp. KBS0706 TaxID=2578109 RepID=UPI00110FF86E|nr:TetR/AcrR family transcriptional regulator [Mycobacterium sp. KBS0706]TSD88275.1 TetR/AcrR family transcriptional regulator [Mycobacterium sp. KBS0706]